MRPSHLGGPGHTVGGFQSDSWELRGRGRERESGGGGGGKGRQCLAAGEKEGLKRRARKEQTVKVIHVLCAHCEISKQKDSK